MHLAEGTLPLAQAIPWGVAAAIPAAWSIAGERRASEPGVRALGGTATAVLFAVTLFPIPIPVAGACSHLCLTPLLGLILGLRRVVWPSLLVLLLHALFFAHGGLTTLGANAFTLGVVGPACTIGLCALGRRIGLSPLVAAGASCALGDLGVYLFDALVLAAGLAGHVPPATTFGLVLAGFAPVQIPLAVIEGILSAFALKAVAARRPDLAPSWIQRRPGPTGSLRAVLLPLSLSGAFALQGCGYEGIDGTVFGAAAGGGGRPPRPSFIDLGGGEMELAMTVLVLFGSGFAAGLGTSRLLMDRHAPPS